MLGEVFVTKSYVKGKKMAVRKSGNKKNQLTSVKVGKKFGSEGPKRSVAKKAKSKLAPMTKDSVTKANMIKKSADILTRIPMIQDTNSPANRNLRKSAYQNLQRAKAQSAAKKIGSARSQMVVTRSRKRSR